MARSATVNLHLPERPCFICYMITNLNPFIPFGAVIFNMICFQIIILYVQCVKYLKP